MSRGKKKESTALATREEERDAAALAELSEFFDNVEVDGMEEVSGEDIRLAVKLFNMGGLDANGDQRKKNEFFDNISEETTKELDAVFLLTQKTHRWDRFDNAEKKTEVLCSSPDRITGRTSEGVVRSCANCPDRGWFRDEEGKPFKKCGEVHNVVGVERLTEDGSVQLGRPFVIRFKKTSLKPWRNHLMQHHYGAGKRGGKRGNVPLFAFAVNVKLAMHESGNYALPIFTRGEVVSRAEFEAHAESAKAYREMMNEVLSAADTADATHATAESEGAGFAADDFSED